MNLARSASSLRLTMLLAPMALATTLAGCSSGAAPGASSASPAASSAPGAPGAVATAEPLKKGLLGGLSLTTTSGEVELHSNKKKIAFAIDLPEGLKDFSEMPSIKAYQRVKFDLNDKKTFEGYSFGVMEGNRAWVTAGLDATIEKITKGGDFEKNNGKVVDKGTTSDGFYFATSIEEKGKKALIAIALVTKGDVSLMCRGNYEGTDAEKSEEVAANMIKVCKTLKITGG